MFEQKFFLDKKKLKQKLDDLKAHNKKVVFTNGCFDLLHPGHVDYLAKAKKLGDILVVGLNTDASVHRLKGESRPIYNELERAEILAGLESIDFICLFDEDTPLELIKTLEPNILVKGGDYTPENIIGREIVEQKGGKTIVLPFVENKSTTNIVEKALKIGAKFA